ncbi:MAG: hypothetical protein MR888_04645 [Clostridiales bacterium]|nr:hypothetical protein [Clostridiales bacterium]
MTAETFRAALSAFVKQSAAPFICVAVIIAVVRFVQTIKKKKQDLYT